MKSKDVTLCMLYPPNQFSDLCVWQGLGIYPSSDPWGRPFTEEYYPERMKQAGLALCGSFKYILDGIQGDADFVAAMFLLNRPMATINNIFLYAFHPWGIDGKRKL